MPVDELEPVIAVTKRSPSLSGLHRVDGIDILRGISILAVMLLHINLRIHLAETPLAQLVSAHVIQTLGRNGANGVTVFFTISGFLITTMSIRRWKHLDRINLGGFYLLRFARIAPLLLFLLIILSVLHLARLPLFTVDSEQGGLGSALFAALTFHINWLEAQRGYLPANWDVL